MKKKKGAAKKLGNNFIQTSSPNVLRINTVCYRIKNISVYNRHNEEARKKQRNPFRRFERCHFTSKDPLAHTFYFLRCDP